MTLMTGLPKASGRDDGFAKLLSVMFLGADENSVRYWLLLLALLTRGKLYYVSKFLGVGYGKAKVSY